eukprot:UN15769
MLLRGTMSHQILAKINAHKIANTEGKEWNRATDTSPSWTIGDRNFINTLESFAAFLITFWLHRLFIDADSTGYLGIIYVTCRTFYGVIYGWKGKWTT